MIVVSADWHLQRAVWKDTPDALYDTYVGARNVIETAVGLKAVAVILAGDVFDTPRPYSADWAVMRWVCETLRDHKVDLYVLDGNHDLAIPSLVDNLPWAKRLTPETVTIDGWQVQGVPHRPHPLSLDTWKTASDTADKLVGPVLTIGHQLLDLTCRLEGMWNLPASSLPRGVTICGDYHRPVHLTHDKGEFMYPGTPALTAADEGRMDHGVILLSLYSGKPVVETAAFPTRMVYEPASHPWCDVFSSDDLETFKTGLSNESTTPSAPFPETNLGDAVPPSELIDFLRRGNISKPLLRVRYDPSVCSMAQLTEIVGNRAHLREVARVGGDATLADSPDGEDSRPDREILAEVVNRLGMNADLVDFVAGLLESPDRADYLAGLRAAHGLNPSDKPNETK